MKRDNIDNVLRSLRRVNLQGSFFGQTVAIRFGLSESDALLAPATLVGTVESIIELLEARRERWQMSYIVVPIESTETLAPVVARLAGT